jgi:hypothetical protein
MILLNVVLSAATLGCVAVLAVWAWHRERAHHRVVSTRLALLPGLVRQAYAEGFLDAMEGPPSPGAEVRPGPDSPTRPLLWINPGPRTASDLHIRRSFRAVESGR